MSELDSSKHAFWKRHEFALLGAVIVVLILTTLLDKSHNYYFQWKLSAVNITRQTTLLALYAMGAAVVIIAGGIDLSTGSVIAFSGTICATLLLWLAPEAVGPADPKLSYAVIALAILGTLFVGFLIGSLHAWLITRIGLPPFVATLGTLVGLRSLSRAIVENVTGALGGGTSTQINIGDPVFRELSGGHSGSVLNLAIIVLVVAAALWVLLSKTVTGRHLYALGGNEQAARLSGIQTDRMKWLAYCISSTLSSLAGILYVSQLTGADPQTQGRGYELNAIAASVVGGCSLQGGVGTIQGTLLGSLFLRVVVDGVANVIKTGADVYEGLIVGVLVVFAVTFTGKSGATGSRRKLFDGALGWVTIGNLTLLAAAMMSLIGVKFVEGRTQMSPWWLAALTASATFLLLLIIRSSISPSTRKRLGIVWTVVVIVSAIGCDFAYPRVQRRSFVVTVQKLGGSVTEGDRGIVVDLSRSRCDDAAFKQIASGMKFFPSLYELRVQETPLTDASLDTLRKSLEGSSSLKRLDVTGSRISLGALTRLKRSMNHLETVP